MKPPKKSGPSCPCHRDSLAGRRTKPYLDGEDGDLRDRPQHDRDKSEHHDDTPPATGLRADSPRPTPGTTADTTDSATPTTTPAATARPTHSQRVTT